MNEIIIYEDPDITMPVQVTLDGETVWLTKEQMAMLFGRELSVIAKHLRNIFKEDELNQEATCAKFAQVQTEGRRRVQRDIDHYNLEAIISVGYRVNSKRGVRFRQWATSILRQHLLQRCTLDQPPTGRTMDAALTALALLVAESLPANKDLLIRLIVNLLLES